MGLFDDPMQELIENVIGYSKLVFLDNKGNFNIMNEEKGHWHNKVWYSNDSYCVPKPYVPTNTYPSTWGRNWNKQDTPEPAGAGRSSLAVNDWVEFTAQSVNPVNEGNIYIYAHHTGTSTT